MRNIIFTSLLTLAVPLQAVADRSCFARDYTDAHLAKHPDQVVKSIVMSMSDGGTEPFAVLSTLVANGGHARGGPHVGQWMPQGLVCFGPKDTVGTVCSVECDGGSLVVTKVTSDSLTFLTEYLLVGDTEGCGGAIDLAEKIGKPVSYKLNRVSTSICSRVLP